MAAGGGKRGQVGYESPLKGRVRAQCRETIEVDGMTYRCKDLRDHLNYGRPHSDYFNVKWDKAGNKLTKGN